MKILKNMNPTNMKLRFFIIAYWHDPRFKKKVGGLIRMFELADNLKQMGRHVTLILPKIGYPKKQTVADVIEIPFIDLPIIRPLSFHLISSLYLLKTLSNADFIYVRQLNSFLPLMISKLCNIPSFFEIPNDPYIAYQSGSKMRRFFERTMDKLSMALSNKIVVLSEWSKKRLNQLGGVPLSKIVVLPSGTDTDLFRPLEKDACCQKVGLDPSFYYIGFVGTFFVHQGIDVLIDAAPLILEKFPNVRFLLVGDGPMMNSWTDKVNQKGLQDVFIFTGQVPYKKVPEYIGTMDICVAPHFKDSNQASPVKIFDYMACGRPIVASDIEVVREIVGDSRCALLVYPGYADDLARGIILLLQGETKRMEMAKKGREWVKVNFDRKKLAEKLILKIQNQEPYRIP
ncbi:MAG: glycosyltransferase family 4 protein [Thermotogota bacterium]|nr:glycosyltransferase family 4 protein [Thermotogota bacterium]